MKTFKDLEFKNHAHAPQFKTQAEMKFKNGFGVSVSGESAYSSDTEPYEVAITDKNNALCYTTHITDDVEGYCTEEKVTKIMKQVQELIKEE